LNFLNEDMTEKDFDRKLKQFVNSSAFTTKVQSVVKDEVKTDKELEELVIEITRNALSQLYKTFWTKRNFWKSQIKNKPV